jgi:hypothetical protein
MAATGWWSRRRSRIILTHWWTLDGIVCQVHFTLLFFSFAFREEMKREKKFFRLRVCLLDVTDDFSSLSKTIYRCPEKLFSRLLTTLSRLPLALSSFYGLKLDDRAAASICCCLKLNFNCWLLPLLAIESHD